MSLINLLCMAISVPRERCMCVCSSLCVCVCIENPKVYNAKIHRDIERGREGDGNSCVAPKTGQTFVA